MTSVIVTKNYAVIMRTGVHFGWDGYTGPCNKEDDELISFVAWFKHHYPHLKDCIVHIPNESMKPVQGRVIDKKKGLLDGAPDIIIVSAGVMICIEFKRRCIKTSLRSMKDREHFERQLNVLESMSKQGAICAVVFGFDEAKRFVKSLDLGFGA